MKKAMQGIGCGQI